MILETKVRIPFLWGKSTFIKTNWAQVNLIVGPNGSGKTLLAEELAVQFSNAGNRIFFVKSDRTDQEKMFFDYEVGVSVLYGAYCKANAIQNETVSRAAEDGIRAVAGFYRDQVGGAIGVFHNVNDNVLLNMGVAYGGENSLTGRAGVTFGW